MVGFPSYRWNLLRSDYIDGANEEFFDLLDKISIKISSSLGITCVTVGVFSLCAKIVFGIC